MKIETFSISSNRKKLFVIHSKQSNRNKKCSIEWGYINFKKINRRNSCRNIFAMFRMVLLLSNTELH